MVLESVNPTWLSDDRVLCALFLFVFSIQCNCDGALCYFLLPLCELIKHVMWFNNIRI